MSYTGIYVAQMDDQTLADFYSKKVKFDLKQNQYLLIKDTNGEIIDKYRNNNGELVKINAKKIESMATGRIKPLNHEQELYFDLLDNDAITVKTIQGNWGSGKSFLAICWAMAMIEKKKFDKFVYVRNNIDVKDTNPVGALPSDLNSKLKPWAMPIADVLGGEVPLDRAIDDGIIELAHLGFIRGRSFENSIIMVTECQNLTSDHIALLISRVGRGSVIIFDGDCKQSDKNVFDKDSGLIKMIECLSGNPLFGLVTLRKTERSATAALAELIN